MRVIPTVVSEVIKIEPPRPDVSRFAFPSTPGMSGYYAQQNAGKRNVSIDLNVPGARELALRLCDTADVVVAIGRIARRVEPDMGGELHTLRRIQLLEALIA